MGKLGQKGGQNISKLVSSLLDELGTCSFARCLSRIVGRALSPATSVREAMRKTLAKREELLCFGTIVQFGSIEASQYGLARRAKMLMLPKRNHTGMHSCSIQPDPLFMFPPLRDPCWTTHWAIQTGC